MPGLAYAKLANENASRFLEIALSSGFTTEVLHVFYYVEIEAVYL